MGRVNLRKPGAFIAFRRGLDASDTEAYPESQFGNASKDSQSRYINIAKHFSSFGAKQGDPEAATGGPMQNRSAKAMNDVFWNDLDSEYSVFMSQIDANETSIGWWRVGPNDQEYGRFARGFQHRSGKDTMFIDIHDHFFGTQGLKAEYPVTLTVTWLDQGNGSWNLSYDQLGGQIGMAFSMTNSNTGRWKKHSVEIFDANFANGGPRSSDLMLINTDNQDEIFHMIRLDRSEISTISNLRSDTPSNKARGVKVELSRCP